MAQSPDEYFGEYGYSSGGPLNHLAMKVYLNSIRNSVSVNKLIRTYSPVTEDELAWLIDDHYENPRNGIQSNKTLSMLSEQLYEAQHKHWKTYRYDKATCDLWVWFLFVRNSLRGIHVVEPLALKALEAECDIENVSFVHPTSQEDEDYRIDLWVIQDQQRKAAVQIKPQSYLTMNDYVHNTNLWRHQRIRQPVMYLYYHKESDEWVFSNTGEVIESIRSLTT